MKNFSGWFKLKQKINDYHHLRSFQEREIWWCSIGVNIGHEEDGKNERFQRPVLIIHKFNKHLFFGVPLTTQIKNNKFYHKIIFAGKGNAQCLHK